MNTQHRVSYRNPGGRASGACHATAQGPRKGSPQNENKFDLFGGGSDYVAASSDLTSLRKCQKGHAQRHFSPRKPSVLQGVWLGFPSTPSLRVVFFRVMSPKQKLCKQNAVPIWWPTLEVASRVDRGSIAIFGVTLVSKTFRGCRFWTSCATVDSATFVGGPQAGATRAARVIG